MLLKLQRTTIVPAQLIGYALTLFIGTLILITTAQLFLDTKTLLYQETDSFDNSFAIISKRISVFKSLEKSRIYFTENELNDLKKQTFIKEIAKVKAATFKILAKTSDQTHKNIPVLTTDLFFESIPDKYLDVKSEDWKWDSTSKLIPIIIPKDYLNLYNFGFAESQGLPVLSENTVSQWVFNIYISGNNKSNYYKSKIVGFSTKINSILVPEKFLSWANDEYGNGAKSKVNRVLIEFNDPSDESLLEYFNKKNYSINKEKLDLSKLVFLFEAALAFIYSIAIIIILLSISFIILSFNFIIEKNKELILNLYDIGYGYRKIALFYQILLSSITFISIILALIVSHLIRNLYLINLNKFFSFEVTDSKVLFIGFGLSLILILFSNYKIISHIKKLVLTR